MLAELKPEDYLFLPAEEAAAPPKGTYFQRYADYWWLVRPGSGLVFYNPMRSSGRRRHGFLGRPQCNTDQRIARGAVAPLAPFEVEVRQFPLVWVEISISDYIDPR